MTMIYVLRGYKDSGKTSTLNRVREVLRNNYPGVVNDDDLGPNSRKDILRILDPVNGYRVGISSMGDTAVEIESRVNKLLAKDPCIIFTAASGPQLANSYFEQLEKQGHSVMEVWFRIPSGTNIQKDNKRARSLIRIAGL